MRCAAEHCASLLEGLGCSVEISSPAALSDPALWKAAATLLAVNVRGRGRHLVGKDRASSSARTTSRRRRGEWCRPVAAVSAVDLLAAQSLMIEHTADAEAWWEHFDLLVTPTTANAPTLLGEYAKGYESGRGSAFTRPFNITGQPAISVPLGWPDRRPAARGADHRADRSRRSSDHGCGRARGRRAVGAASGYGERMIVAVVNFELPAPLTTDEARAMFEASAPSYQNVDGLLPQALPAGRRRPQCRRCLPLGQP